MRRYLGTSSRKGATSPKQCFQHATYVSLASGYVPGVRTTHIGIFREAIPTFLAFGIQPPNFGDTDIQRYIRPSEWLQLRDGVSFRPNHLIY